MKAVFGIAFTLLKNSVNSVMRNLDGETPLHDVVGQRDDSLCVALLETFDCLAWNATGDSECKSLTKQMERISYIFSWAEKVKRAARTLARATL